MLSSIFTIVGLTAVNVVKFVSLMFLSSSNKKKVASVTKIVLYPVKGCGGICVNNAEFKDSILCSEGVYDRSYVVITTETNSFLNQSRCTQLTLIQPTLDHKHKGRIILTHPSGTSVSVDLVGPSRKFKMREERLTGIDCGDEVAAWLNQVCQRSNLRLIYRGSAYRTMEDELKVMERRRFLHMPVSDLVHSAQSKVFYADFAPILLLSQQSIDDLNKRMRDRNPDCQLIDWRSFRPNLLVASLPDSGSEEEWRFATTQHCTFTCVVPAERCSITTLDQDKGTYRKDGEPLKTLRTYRHDSRWPTTGCLFGMYCFVEREGPITLGDAVFALDSDR